MKSDSTSAQFDSNPCELFINKNCDDRYVLKYFKRLKRRYLSERQELFRLCLKLKPHAALSMAASRKTNAQCLRPSVLRTRMLKEWALCQRCEQSISRHFRSRNVRSIMNTSSNEKPRGCSSKESLPSKNMKSSTNNVSSRTRSKRSERNKENSAPKS